MARPEKTAVVEEISRKLDAADAAVLTEYRGLSVSALAELRSALRPAGTEYKVFKNTLARRAVEGSGHTELLPMLEGPVAIAFVHGDAVLAAKALRDFGRSNPSLILKGGLLGLRVLTPAEIEELADVQPREVLLARLAGGFQAPLNKAASLFQVFPRNLAYGLKAYVDQRVEGGEILEVPAAEAPASEELAADVAPAAAETETAEEAVDETAKEAVEDHGEAAERAPADGQPEEVGTPSAASEAIDGKES